MDSNVLAEFFESLASKLKTNLSSASEIQSMTQFYLKFNFEQRQNQDDDEQMLNFLFLGWYIYSQFQDN